MACESELVSIYRAIQLLEPQSASCAIFGYSTGSIVLIYPIIHSDPCFNYYLGLEVHIDEIGQQLVVKVHVVYVYCDLPAKALVQNYIQFNGAFGCGFCKQPGEILATDKGGHVVTFPFFADNPKGPRTQHSNNHALMMHMRQCAQSLWSARQNNAFRCLFYLW